MPLLSRRVLTSLRCDLHSKKLAEDVADVAAGSIVVGLRAAVDTSRHAPRHAMEPPKRNGGADPRADPGRTPGVRPTVSQAPQTRVSQRGLVFIRQPFQPVEDHAVYFPEL